MLLDADECQLVLVDYQTRLMPAIADGTQVLANAVWLARMAQAMRVPVLATEQNPDRLGASAPELGAVLVESRASVFSKMAFSACADGLVDGLRPPERKPHTGGNAHSLPKHLQKAVAHVCLLQTALELLEQEFEVWVVTDACGSRTERNRDAAYDRLAGNGAELVTTEMVAFDWLRSADHPLFKSIHALIK